MKHLALTVLCLGFVSCSGSRGTAVREDFRVEYYSYGGISGSAEGVTVTGDGWARFWKGRTAALRTSSDSLQVEGQLEKIQALVDSCEASSLRYEGKGDLTTVLTIQRKSRYRMISFAGGQIPGSFPRPVRELILLLRNLRTTKTEVGR